MPTKTKKTAVKKESYATLQKEVADLKKEIEELKRSRDLISEEIKEWQQIMEAKTRIRKTIRT